MGWFKRFMEGEGRDPTWGWETASQDTPEPEPQEAEVALAELEPPPPPSPSGPPRPDGLPTKIEAGWYPVPGGRLRWWNGTAWTEDFAPGNPSQDPDSPMTSTAITGIAFALLIPVIGFFIGIALIAAKDRHGGLVTGLSVAMCFVWFTIAAASMVG